MSTSNQKNIEFNFDLANTKNLVKYSQKTLKNRLIKHFHIMKNFYKTNSYKNNKTSSEEWFTDNFYIIEKETKSILSSLKNKISLSGIKNNNLPLIYQIAYKFFVSSGFKEVSEENVIAMMSQALSKTYLSVDELAFLSTTIKIILIDNIYFSIILDDPDEITANSIAFSIKNLKNIESLDFDKIIQKISPIEKIFLQDPEDIYSKMDDESKSYYRYLLACVAKKKNTNEEKLAQDILKTAKKENKHIGHFLKETHNQVFQKNKIQKIFLGINIFLPIFLSLTLLFFTKNLFVSLICYLPFWEIVKNLNEYFILKIGKTECLPKLDIKNEVPEEGKTLVVVSTMLPKADQAKHLKTRLENLYFSNGAGNVNFCVLADFGQNKYPQAANDKSQIDASVRVISLLNQKYDNRFFLIVRKRTFSKTQNSYIGWERKRGAITELIRLIKNQEQKEPCHSCFETHESQNNFESSILICEGDKTKLKGTKYIVALDSDTELLMDSTQKLVATALHPLNKPVVDQNKKIVTSGHAIFTPKIGTDLASAKNTFFSRIMAGCGGITMYDVAAKDLYQNLFGESIFAGKGLIDVNVFFELLDNKFPKETILSHDILEGIFLRAGFVSDVEITDSHPSNISSWLSRLHRWIRGDWQNVSYLFDKNLSFVNKYKLFDNLRRSLNPIFSLLTILTGIFLIKNNIAFNNFYYGHLVFAIGFFSVTFGSLFSCVVSIFSNSWFAISRKFYTPIIPQAFEHIFQAIFLIIMLIAQSVTSVDAIAKALYRKFVSKQKLLEWVTAAQSESQQNNLFAKIKKFILPEIFGILILLIAPTGTLKLLGLMFSFILPLAIVGNSKNTQETQNSPKFPTEYKEILTGYVADMWKFYEDHFTLSCNYLPPDNIQLSPIKAVAYRTSPTNIGFLLISTLAARDFDFIDTNTLYVKINHTLTTIENLKKWHGNLYNWYDIQTLEPLDQFVSTVDSGNFVCCLVAVKEGLKDYYFEKKELSDLVDRLQKLIDETELDKFYCKKRNLFSIGYNMQTEKLFDSYYDFLMSEARLTSYFAIAKRQAPKKHWGVLSRTLSRNGLYAGPVSWTGTMFEFFMPHLLLPSFSGSLLDESLRYCIYCQQKRCEQKRCNIKKRYFTQIPWGISESAFFAFDNNLYYQYKAHGVQKLGVKQNLNKELVISPYSTYLTVSFAPKMAMKNLFELEKLGAKGPYGFFEAVDFTKSRVQEMEVIKSYMAHHIGMSIIAANNAIFNNRMQKRFMRDKNMRATKELLEEKISRDSVVFDNILKPVPEKNLKISKTVQEFENISPEKPNIAIFKNSDLTNILTDNGTSCLVCGDKCLTQKTVDLFRKPQGFFLFIYSDNNLFSATPAPFYNQNISYQTNFSSHCVSYLSKSKSLQTTMVSYLDKTLACEQRQIIIKNISNSKKRVQALITLEPILTQFNEYIAHPAFNKLFITSEYDSETNILIFEKKPRENQAPVYFGIGFLENIKFNYISQKEKLFYSSDLKNSVINYFQNKSKNNSENQNSNGLPDAIAAISFDFDLSSSLQKDFTLILTSAESRSEIINNILQNRTKKHLDAKSSAKSQVHGDSIEDKIASQLLPFLLFHKQFSSETLVAMSKNKDKINTLWSMSISGDLPIVLLQVTGTNDYQRVDIYVKTLKKLRISGILFDLVLTYRDLQGENILKNFINSIIKKSDILYLVNIKGGIFLINLTEISKNQLNIIKALAHYIVPENLLASQSEQSKFLPVEIKKTQKQLPKNLDLSQGHKINGGVFFSDRFFVNNISSLPYCHVLANQTFGSLVSDKNLGFSWASNSRENKLTPWFNDIAYDNDGELLILKCNNSYFNLLNGAFASFSPKNAKYYGKIKDLSQNLDLEYIVTTYIPQKGNNKFCEIEFENKSNFDISFELAYYLEPILGVNYLDNQKIYGFFKNNTIILKHCLSQTMLSLSVTSDAITKYKYINQKAKFFTGNWEPDFQEIFEASCASLISELKISQNSKKTAKFCLSFVLSEKQLQNNKNLFSEPQTPNINKIIINTPDKALNYMINTWVPHQIICGRIWARTGFFQCGGAFGFRDQLQDSLCYITLNPQITKQQILRASAAQFEEGDVLHWWHNIPCNPSCNSENSKENTRENIRGVRTRYSDDLLWLPYVVSEYITKTGDLNLLDIKTSYINGPLLENGEYEKYFMVCKSNIKESIYHHCLKAIEKSLMFGKHGLPLIGCGDWSDGYNRVGISGQGESVWLGMFLAIILEKFSEICKIKDDKNIAEKYLSLSKTLKENIDKNCWDGNWYLRAFFDNGDKMGSHECDECKIDSLSQSFSVFAKMPNQNRVQKSLESSVKHLVDDKNMIIKLFTPAFEKSNQNPGYVKSYPGGIRENGGQYTHAGMWLAMALIESGNTDKGYELLKILNPASRAENTEIAQKYMIEPYYLAGDIYSNKSAFGHGGWSIYTGAAGWFFKTTVETLLGINLENNYVEINPHLPSCWENFETFLELKNTKINLKVSRIKKNQNHLQKTQLPILIKLDHQEHKTEIFL